MADFKISQLDVMPGGDITADDVIIINNGNVTTKSTTLTNLFSSDVVKDLIAGGDGSGTAGAFLRLDAGAGDQTVESTGTTTFDGRVDANRGIRITGGNTANVENGIAQYSATGGLKFIANSTDVISVRGSGNSGLLLDQTVNSSRTSGNFTSSSANTTVENHGTNNVIGFRSRFNAGSASAGEIVNFDAFVSGTPTNVASIIGYRATSSLNRGSLNYGFYSDLSGDNNFNYFAPGDAPNFFQGNTYIGGTTSTTTRELWESTLTEEQKEQLGAGTLTVPANVSTPGDGSFVRQWWYDQQSVEDQELFDFGELEYPSQFQAANFVDKFDLGEFTKINLLSTGRGEFSGGIKVTGGHYNNIDHGLGLVTSGPGGDQGLYVVSDDKIQLRADGVIRISGNTDSAQFSNNASVINGRVAIDYSSNVIHGASFGCSNFSFTGSDVTNSFACYRANAQNTTEVSNAPGSVYGFSVLSNLHGLATDNVYGFHSALNSGSKNRFNYFASGDAPNFLKGDTYIGGSTSTTTRELWESTLTEEQKEQLDAGTLAIPANVSIPGDGSFVRQWWYDQQSVEDQALIDAGELEYPERYQAANFVDTFVLGDLTSIDFMASAGVARASGIQFKSPTQIGNIDYRGFYFASSFAAPLCINHPEKAGDNFSTLVIKPYSTDDNGNNRTSGTVNGLNIQNKAGGVSDEINGILIAGNSAATLANDGVVSGLKINQGPISSDGKSAYSINSIGNSPSYFEGLVESAGGVEVTGSSNLDNGIIFDNGLSLRSLGGQAVNFTNDRAIRFLPDKDGLAIGWQTGAYFSKNISEYRGFSSYINESDNAIPKATHFEASQLNSISCANVYGFSAAANLSDATTASYGFYGNLAISTGPANYNFYAAGSAPNFFAGSVIHSTHADGMKPYDGTNFSLEMNGNIFKFNRNTKANSAVIRMFNSDGTAGSQQEVGLISTMNDGTRFDANDGVFIVNSTPLTFGTAGFFTRTDARVFTNPTEITNAAALVKQLAPKREGFIAHELQQHVDYAVTGTQDETETYGTLADYDGTVLETEVTEPSELEYTEDVTDSEGVTTQAIRSRTWTATGTRPVYQGVDQTKLIPLLTKALQEALKRIEALEAAAGI